jgi:hypothetical protein
MLRDHATVSLIDCVADLLGHGVPVDILEDSSPADIGAVSTISQSPRAKEIATNATRLHMTKKVMILYALEWSDGFEPSLSIKGNRGSIWIKTVTISPTIERLHSMAHTYPIALGYDTEDHEEVEEKFASELMQLRSGKVMDFYHGGVKKMVRVHLDLFCSLQDQPERRSANYIMLGGSKYTARWGLAGDFAAVASGIPACSVCWSNLLTGT